MESRDLRIETRFAHELVRRSFDSLCSLRMTVSWGIATNILLRIRYLVGGVMTPPYILYHLTSPLHRMSHRGFSPEFDIWREIMAIFSNQATLTYNGHTTNSNIAYGEILDVLAATKTSVEGDYTPGGAGDLCGDPAQHRHLCPRRADGAG